MTTLSLCPSCARVTAPAAGGGHCDVCGAAVGAADEINISLVEEPQPVGDYYLG